jgi:light-regulated signal transduction histidine kinase (bacteriophytochrome)
MNNLNAENLQQALEQCAAEPIHQIGSIQPHGILLVISNDRVRTLKQASTNIIQFLEVSTDIALGRPLIDVIGETAALEVEDLIKIACDNNTATGIINFTQFQQAIRLDAHLYLSDDWFVLELSDDQGLESSAIQLDLEASLTAIMNANDAKTCAYFEQIADLVRSLTDYDNVMIYRFDPNWDGEVIAQSKVESATDYLGKYFPASDIPPQARQLYTQNLVRIVANVNAENLPVLPTMVQGRADRLDMTHSSLRSLSPIHMEYLRNMGVEATMTISLLQNGRLWGLIACHHHTPKRVSVALREQAILISQTISSKLSALEDSEQQSLINKALSISQRLTYSLPNLEIQLSEALFADIVALFNANGVSISFNGSQVSHGTVPNPQQVAELLSWLGKQDNHNVVNCDYLTEQLPTAIDYQDIASGLLAIPLSADLKNNIIWFRKEKPRTVNWAGVYAQGLTQTASGNYRLSPRKSFEIWSETWRGRCSPWLHTEIRMAEILTKTLVEPLNKA